MTCISESKKKPIVTGIPEVVSVVPVSGSLKQITFLLKDFFTLTVNGFQSMKGE